jgi:CRP-like cAMP-binding protein
MEQSRRASDPGENRLLAALPRDVQARLLSKMEKVPLASQQVLYGARTPLTHVWFLLRGVVSLVITMKNEATVEVATIGNEGLVGTPVFLGADHSFSQVLCQVSGQALRMRVDSFKRAVRDHSELHHVVQCYIQALISQISQSTACNHLHTMQERMCRWLLMTHDRVGMDEFNLTQEFLAEMLGVRRPSVTVTAGILQKAGLIRYRRGRIRVLDRAGLEACSCECYEVVREEFDRLLA